MPKYKVGDVAALFPDPQKPKTDSGKKIQSLFEEFYKKPPKKTKVQDQPEGKDKQAESIATLQNAETVKEKKPKKEKRKFQNTSAAEEIIATNLAKKAKMDLPASNAPFPRSKKGKTPENQSYLVRNRDVYPETDETEDLFPRKKSKQQNNNNNKKKKPNNPSPKKQPNNPSLKKKKKKNKVSKRKEENVETDAMEQSKEAEKNDDCPDFLSLEPNITESNSKVVFRMKKKRDIPSCKEIFEDNDQVPSLNENRYYDPSPKTDVIVRERVEETEERLSRTLFVGNLPVNIKEKHLMTLFKPFGHIESCRLRGAVPQKSTIPRKIAQIRGEYHSRLNSVIAYVVMKEKKNAIEALSLAGTVIKGHHINVDRASASGEKKVYDNKRSIFVGNLPFDIKEDTVRATFSPFGDVEYVRVIRDRETGAGKGFGYVSFQTIQGKEKALSMPNVTIEGRSLRIQSTKGEKKSKPQLAVPTWKAAVKRIAIKERMKSGNTNSRKTLVKIMNKKKQQHQKKKIANIFKKFSKN